MSIATNDRGETSKVLGQIRSHEANQRKVKSNLVGQGQGEGRKETIRNIKAKSEAKVEEEGGGDSLGRLSYTR